MEKGKKGSFKLMNKKYVYNSIYSPWSFHTDPPEMKKKEHERWSNLTPQQRHEEYKSFFEMVQREQEERNKRKRELEKARNEAEEKRLYVNTESPHSLEDAEATVSWIIIMLIGSIFKERWVVWLIATIIYLCWMNRYAIREWKWENGGKEAYHKRIEDACKGDKK